MKTKKKKKKKKMSKDLRNHIFFKNWESWFIRNNLICCKFTNKKILIVILIFAHNIIWTKYAILCQNFRTRKRICEEKKIIGNAYFLFRLQ